MKTPIVLHFLFKSFPINLSMQERISLIECNSTFTIILVVDASLSLSPQHTSLSASRSEKGTGWSSRSLGARCRNSIALCSDEQPHIGNYRLLKTIGKGNFAKVKLARHILTGREVSLKKQEGDDVLQKLEVSVKLCMLGSMRLKENS